IIQEPNDRRHGLYRSDARSRERGRYHVRLQSRPVRRESDRAYRRSAAQDLRLRRVGYERHDRALSAGVDGNETVTGLDDSSAGRQDDALLCEGDAGGWSNGLGEPDLPQTLTAEATDERLYHPTEHHQNGRRGERRCSLRRGRPDR